MSSGHKPDTEVSFGIDIGGTKVLGVALDGADQVVAESRVPTPQGLASSDSHAISHVMDAVVAVSSLLAAEVGTANSGIPIGVGAPGMLHRTGTLVHAPNLPIANGADFSTLLTDRLSGPVVVENDANLAALAEHHMGAAKGADNTLMVTLGTGIGGGIISEGRVLLGAFGFAGEIGHMVVDPSGPPCPCGRRGCWERYASGGGLGRLAREAAYAGSLPRVIELAGGDAEDVRGEHVTRAAVDGDHGALAVLDEFAWWVALGLTNLVAVVDASRIVLGGGLAEAGDMFLGPTRRAFADLVEGGSARPPIAIVAAMLGERAGAVGGALAARAGGLSRVGTLKADRA